mgnify:FL=1
MKKIVLVICILSTFLFGKSLDEIRSGGVIRVGVADNWKPFSVKDGNSGGFKGFDIELSKKIATKIFGNLDGKVMFIDLDADDRIPALEDDVVDIIAWGFVSTPEREKLVDFSLPYVSFHLAALTKTGSEIARLDDLRKSKVAVVSWSFAESEMERMGIDTLSYPEEDYAYEAVKSGEVDAYVDDNLRLMSYSAVDGGVEVAIKKIDQSVFYSLGTKKGNKELLDEINKALIGLSKEGFFKKAYDEIFAPFYKDTVDKNQFLLDEFYSIIG